MSGLPGHHDDYPSSTGASQNWLANTISTVTKKITSPLASLAWGFGTAFILLYLPLQYAMMVDVDIQALRQQQEEEFSEKNRIARL